MIKKKELLTAEQTPNSPAPFRNLYEYPQGLENLNIREITVAALVIDGQNNQVAEVPMVGWKNNHSGPDGRPHEVQSEIKVLNQIGVVMFQCGLCNRNIDHPRDIEIAGLKPGDALLSVEPITDNKRIVRIVQSVDMLNDGIHSLDIQSRVRGYSENRTYLYYELEASVAFDSLDFLTCFSGYLDGRDNKQNKPQIDQLKREQGRALELLIATARNKLVDNRPDLARAEDAGEEDDLIIIKAKTIINTRAPIEMLKWRAKALLQPIRSIPLHTFHNTGEDKAEIEMNPVPRISHVRRYIQLESQEKF